MAYNLGFNIKKSLGLIYKFYKSYKLIINQEYLHRLHLNNRLFNFSNTLTTFISYSSSSIFNLLDPFVSVLNTLHILSALFISFPAKLFLL